MSNKCLKNLNTHERDKHIHFDEEPHIYYIDGVAYKRSVTSFIHDLFPKFDSHKVATLTQQKHSSNIESEYYDKSVDEIKDMWAQSGKDASAAGTKLHKAIEDFFNKREINDENVVSSTEFQYFLNFIKDFPELKPYRTEWEVFQEDHKIAGSIDMLFENDDSTLTIYDWKRSKNIRMTNRFEKGKEFNTKHLDNCNFVHYSMQLNVYKYFLESKYSKKIRDMYILVLHPNNNNYKRYAIPDMQEDIRAILSPKEIKT
jgi:hypothetical protein